MLAELARGKAVRDARAARLVAKAERLDRARRRAAFHIGACLARMLKERLYVNAGHASFAELARSLGLGRSQAFKLVTIAERSSEAEVEELGVEEAYRRAVSRSG